MSPRSAAAVAIGARAAGRRRGDRRRVARRACSTRSSRRRPSIRAGLVGGSAGARVVLLSRSVARLAGGHDDVRGLIRGVRLAFLAVAAGAAAAGWALGHPLPLSSRAVIAGVDVVETSFLLLVVGRT